MPGRAISRSYLALSERASNTTDAKMRSARKTATAAFSGDVFSRRPYVKVGARGKYEREKRDEESAADERTANYIYICIYREERNATREESKTNRVAFHGRKGSERARDDTRGKGDRAVMRTRGRPGDGRENDVH